MAPLKLFVVSFLAWGGNPEGEVLDFTAGYCAPCQQMKPIVSQLERQGYPIRQVDCEANPDLVRKYNVVTIPAFILVIDGVEQERLNGKVSAEQLKKLCSRIPKKPEAKPASLDKPAAASRNGLERLDVPPTPPQGLPQVEAPAPAKTGIKWPFGGAQAVDPKKDAPARDPLEGAIQRGNEYDSLPAPQPVQGNALASSVRIRMKHTQIPDEVGSGTIIDSRIGSTTILTCGHIFRNWDKQCVIQVDYFSAGKVQTFVGKRIYHNLDDDVALISLNVDPLPACRVGPPGMKIALGLPVISVGCSQGDKPTEQALKITFLNRYQGADNIECSGVPKQGRSGGGLFTRDGQLIGVCNAAAPHHKEGLYAGLKTVQALLDRCKLAHLYRPAAASDSPRYADRSDAASDDETAGTDFDADDALADPRKIVKVSATKPAPRRRPSTEALEADDTAIREALEQSGEAEIVCIIRPINQPRAASRVLILNRASRKFVEYLSDEMDSQQEITETTLQTKAQEVRRRPVTAPQAASPKKIAPTAASAGAAAPSHDESTKPNAPRAYRRKQSSQTLAHAAATP